MGDQAGIPPSPTCPDKILTKSALCPASHGMWDVCGILCLFTKTFQSEFAQGPAGNIQLQPQDGELEVPFHPA